MTNVSSGSKRSWEGNEASSNKRAREKEDPRDWKDVHLSSPKRREDRRRHDYRDEHRDEHHSRSREHDHYRRSGDYRDRDRREGRDRDRERDRARDRDHGSRRDVDKDGLRRDDSRRHSPAPRHANGRTAELRDGTPKVDSEKEEGE